MNYSGPKVILLLFVLNSTEHEMYNDDNVKMPTFISMINTTPERLKARKVFFFQKNISDHMSK